MDKSKLKYRKASAEDLPELKAMARETGIKNYIPFLGEENVMDFINSGALDKDINEHYTNMILCIYEDEIAGFIGYFDNLIHILQTKHKYQRLGIGTKLLKSAEQELLKTNKTIRLETFEANEQAKNFYIKNGWYITGREYSEYIKGYKVFFEKRRPEEQC